MSRRCQRWSFADCIFDEGNWSLIVGDRRVSIETKPLVLLRELLLRSGNVVSKSELLDTIWPNVTVVEASLPTAVRKLRLALNDDQRDVPIIETVSRIGYRLAAPVEIEELPDAPGTPIAGAQDAAVEPIVEQQRDRRLTLFGMAGVLVIASVAVALAFAPSSDVSTAKEPRTYSQREQLNALRKLDVGAIETMLAAGWVPDTPYDKDDNGALNMLLNNCEWDPGHDQRKMLLAARTLIDGGAELARRNVWGDTPYSIARAERYCGPNHPVTKMLRTLCYAGYKPLGDRCLATYELNSKQ